MNTSTMQNGTTVEARIEAMEEARQAGTAGIRADLIRAMGEHAAGIVGACDQALAAAGAEDEPELLALSRLASATERIRRAALLGAVAALAVERVECEELIDELADRIRDAGGGA